MLAMGLVAGAESRAMHTRPLLTTDELISNKLRMRATNREARRTASIT
jgi:hypothetical protein